MHLGSRYGGKERVRWSSRLGIATMLWTAGLPWGALAQSDSAPGTPAVFSAPSPTQKTGKTSPDLQAKSRPDLGFALVAGGTSGLGPGLRVHWPRGLSLTVGGYYLPAGDVHSADLGLQLLWTFWRRRYARAYLMAGAHYFDAVAASPGGFRWKWPGFRVLNLGPGLGTEFRKGRVGVAVEMPLSVAFALTPETHLKYQGRWNFLPLPNAWFTIYLK